MVHTHHIANTEVAIGYADVHGDLLPINNDDNFCKAVSSANPLLRVFIQKRGTVLARPPLRGVRLSVVSCCRTVRLFSCRGSEMRGAIVRLVPITVFERLQRIYTAFSTLNSVGFRSSNTEEKSNTEMVSVFTGRKLVP